MANPEVFITVRVGNELFVLDTETAKKSRILRGIIEAHIDERRLKDVYTIQGDPDIFVHVWKYLVNDTFPFHYDPQTGHDYALYACIQRVALKHGLMQLHDYLANQVYLQAIQMNTTVKSLRGCDKLQYLHSASTDFEFVPQWISRKRYVCPRGIEVHMGCQASCGKACEKERGDNPVEYEDVPELVIMRIKKEINFDGSILFPIPANPGQMQR